MANHPTVYLKGIPYYRQGTHDSLCTYYSACMMLSALIPELEINFGEGDRKRRQSFVTEDPIIQAFAFTEKGEATPAKALADWYYRGKTLEAAWPRLNDVIAVARQASNALEYICENTWNDTKFTRICAAIDIGLPVMLGWSSRDMGNHCVTVVGYTRGQKRWLSVHDPGGTDDVCWDTLVDISSSPIELLIPRSESFTGPRPDQVRYSTSPEGKRKDECVYRWWPTSDGTCKYTPLLPLFEMARKEAAEKANRAA